MSPFDYLRLGTANILGHKKRCFTVIIIISAIISVLTAGALVIQGTENQVLATNNRLSNGKVLLQTTADTSSCPEDDQSCNLDTKITDIKTTIVQSGGEVIDVPNYQDQFTNYFALPPSILSNSATAKLDQLPPDTLPLLLSPYTAATWLQIPLPLSEQSPTQKVSIVEKIRTAALYHTITNQPSHSTRKFFVLDLSPSGISTSGLNLSAVRQDSSPFNIILSNIPTGDSQTFLIDSPAVHEQLGEPVASTSVWALFPNSTSAYDYSQNSAFHCEDFAKIRNKCPKKFLGEVTPAFGDPLTAVPAFRGIRTVYTVICIILMIIGTITIISTFSRLIAGDSKTISLYYATGASKSQIFLIYSTYLLCISFLASLCALIIGTILALILNLCNTTALSQIFTLAFGIAPQTIILIGWDSAIIYLIATIFVTSILTPILNFHQFSPKKLAQKLK